MSIVEDKRYCQTERGLSVNQDKIRPKLTSAQKKTMTETERKEYNAGRLKEYRNEYISLYSKQVVSKEKLRQKQEKIDALIFYKNHLKQQQAIAV